MLSFHGATDNSGDIVFLHTDKEKHHGDCNDDCTGAEDCVVFVNICFVNHGIQTFGHREVVIIVLHNDRHKDVIDYWVDKSVDGSCRNDWLGVWQDDFPENCMVGCSVQYGGFVQRLGNGIEISFCDIVVQGCSAGIDQNQCQKRLVQTDRFHKVVNCDHAHEAGEHSQNQGDVHKKFAAGEAKPRVYISNH